MVPRPIYLNGGLTGKNGDAQTHHVYVGFLAYCLVEVEENKNLRTRKNEPGYVIRFATSTGLACQCIDRGAEVIVGATS